MSYINNFYDPFSFGGLYKPIFPYGSHYIHNGGSHTQKKSHYFSNHWSPYGPSSLIAEQSIRRAGRYDNLQRVRASRKEDA
jgi:hypothetical protein